MAGYFGTDTQKRLQARVDEKAEWIASTPGACNSGRVLGCDDIDLLGWPTVKDIMENDGAMGFRLLPRERAGEVGDWMQSRGYRIDFYDPFVGERSEVLNATDRILSEPLPDGLKVGPSPTEPIGPLIEAIQRLMLENGVAPYSGSLLAGAYNPAITVVILDASNSPVSVAFGHKPHNTHSRYHRYGYGGAVVVAQSHRGLGLGRRVNALIASRILRELDATHFYEFVASDNEPSRRMVQACALKQTPSLAAGMAVASDQKFTR